MTQKSVPPMLAAEPWMRGTHNGLDSLRRAVIHALEQALEDADRWAAVLGEEAIEQRPVGLPSVGFHLRHIARSLDRLLTYAEDRQLSQEQLDALASEEQSALMATTLHEFRNGLHRSLDRVVRFRPDQLEEARGVGRKRLPTTVGGLLVHCAEHTQRHTGQMVTTAKIVQKLAQE